MIRDTDATVKMASASLRRAMFPIYFLVRDLSLATSRIVTVNNPMSVKNPAREVKASAKDRIP